MRSTKEKPSLLPHELLVYVVPGLSHGVIATRFGSSKKSEDQYGYTEWEGAETGAESLPHATKSATTVPNTTVSGRRPRPVVIFQASVTGGVGFDVGAGPVGLTADHHEVLI